MTFSLYDWQTWLIAAFALGVIELMLGTVLLGGMAIGALVTALAVAVFGAQMAASGLDWALPLAVWAAASLVGTWIASAIFGRVARRSGEDINDAPYKGD